MNLQLNVAAPPFMLMVVANGPPISIAPSDKNASSISLDTPSRNTDWLLSLLALAGLALQQLCFPEGGWTAATLKLWESYW